MLHLVLQGTKSLSIGDQVLHFAPATYFIVPVDLPALGQVCGATPGETNLALSLTLAPATIAALLADLCEADRAGQGDTFAVSAATPVQPRICAHVRDAAGAGCGPVQGAGGVKWRR